MVRIPIELRSNEQSQLDEYVPMSAEHLRDIGLDGEADSLDDVSLIDNEDGTFSAEATEWSSIIGGLRTLRDSEGVCRINYLRKKLAKRLSSKLEDFNVDEDGDVDDKDESVGVSGEETPVQSNNSTLTA